MVNVTIGGKDMKEDFGCILASREISPPAVQTKNISVPMRDGSIDLTEAVTGTPKYEDRTIKLKFMVLTKDLLDVYSNLQNFCHGQRMKVIFDDDPAFYYIGRLSVSDWEEKKEAGIISIDMIAEPYKYDISSSAVDWEWDTFDFENGIVNELGQLVVSGETEVTIVCRKKVIFPTFSTSAAMQLRYYDQIYELKKGSQKIYRLFLSEGYNTLTFRGNGTVSIDYTGGML